MCNLKIGVYLYLFIITVTLFNGCRKEDEVPRIVGNWNVTSQLETRDTQTDTIAFSFFTGEGEYEAEFFSDETAQIVSSGEKFEWDYYANDSKMTLIFTNSDGSYYHKTFDIEVDMENYQKWVKEIRVPDFPTYNIEYWELQRIQ